VVGASAFVTNTDPAPGVKLQVSDERWYAYVGGKTSITFEFRADQPGIFPFYCNLTTDPGCKEMRGTLSVRAK